MNIINSSLHLPRLTKSNVNFSNVDVDESCGNMSVRFNLITDDTRFDCLIDFLHDKLRHEYYNPWNELEPEFEQSLNRDIDFVITMTDYGNYEFNLFAYGGEDTYTSAQVGLYDDEIELFKPYMYKYFEPSYQLEQLRRDVERSVNQIIPAKKLVGMRLISDRIVDNAYKAAWISENKKKCMVCEVADYTDDKCPAIVIKFGF